MFRHINNNSLLWKAIDRISKSRPSNEEAGNDLHNVDYDHTPFNILKFIEEPYRYA